MSEDIRQKDWEIWQRFVQSYLELARASNDFLSNDVNRVPILKQALLGQGRPAAVYILGLLSSNELQRLFDELVYLASWDNGMSGTVYQAILSIPKEWLLENIEIVSEPYLENGSGEVYRLFLGLFYKIDTELTRKLALRALEQDDHDVREAGQDFLDRINRI